MDFPITATFLTPEERAFVIWRKSEYIPPDMYDVLAMLTTCPAEYDNSSVGEAEKFEVRYVWAAFKDWQVNTLCI